MGRTNDIWIVNVYFDEQHKVVFRMLEFNTLKEIASCLDKPIYEVSNFYHRIKKASGVFRYLYIYKSIR